MYDDLFKSIESKLESISIIGLGYVGMPLAISFAKKVNVIGFDINEEKINQYNKFIDVTNEVGNDELKYTKALFTSKEEDLKQCKFHIIAVPTPTNDDKTPNLNPMINATKILARNLVEGSIVVYESTVYPGVTEEVCIPILEEITGFKHGIDFKVGYSPERINPGDKLHRLENIVKVVSGMDKESLEIIAKVYELVIEAGVHRAQSIKVAEAAKVIENSQRDINIAFINELSIIFNIMGIDTKSVLDAAKTKWNFIDFKPGLVGGHCIGVDPYYLTHKAEQLGYHSQVILSGRRINDGMGKYVAESTIKNLIRADNNVKGSKVAILGMTFKENCPDIRNSKVIDIINELEEYGVKTYITDPIADSDEIKKEYNLELTPLVDINDMDAIIVAVNHSEYSRLNLSDLKRLYRNNKINYKRVLIDIKGIFNREEAIAEDYIYWRL